MKARKRHKSCHGKITITLFNHFVHFICVFKNCFLLLKLKIQISARLSIQNSTEQFIGRRHSNNHSNIVGPQDDIATQRAQTNEIRIQYIDRGECRHAEMSVSPSSAPVEVYIKRLLAQLAYHGG